MYLKSFVAILTLTTFFLSGIFSGLGSAMSPAFAEDITIDLERFAGNTRYETTVNIARENWEDASTVVLARGDSFPDALAGAVLANSSLVGGGPLLLTKPKQLGPEVLKELQRLNTNSVFILGGTGAISTDVEEELVDNGILVDRIHGNDRYETAANISTRAIKDSTKAFLVSGESFADALSISSYAAAKNIPLLLTTFDHVPQVTIDALVELGVTDVSLIGGKGVIGSAVEEQLGTANYKVDRLRGGNRYDTNTTILNSLDFNLDQIIVATGASFPDALAGSVLAARNNNPILLVPKDEKKIPNTSTGSYLNNNKPFVNNFFILGGSGVVNNKIENFLRTGKMSSRISLQFWDGYGDLAMYEKTLSYVPNNLTDYVHVLSPNFAGDLRIDGSFGYSFSNSTIPKYLVGLGQSKGAQVVPLVYSDGKVANDMLRSPDKRKRFADSAVKMVEETNANGFLVDLEGLADDTTDGLTALMQDIYGRLSPQGKLVMVSVMAKTSDRAEPWTAEYNYRDLSKYADYIQIMSYDKHWQNSPPGPVAPLDWVRQVMAYAVTVIPEEKILMGIPYYGRAWRQDGNAWTSKAFGWAIATQTAAEYGIKVEDIPRETTSTDEVGVPTFQYTDASGCTWTAYFDDRQSWGAKLDLLEEYNLGGIGSWSMRWVNEDSATELFPLLKERMN